MYSTEKRSSCRDRLRNFGAKLAFLGRYSIFTLSNIALDREHSARAFLSRAPDLPTTLSENLMQASIGGAKYLHPEREQNGCRHCEVVQPHQGFRFHPAR